MGVAAAKDATHLCTMLFEDCGLRLAKDAAIQIVRKDNSARCDL